MGGGNSPVSAGAEKHCVLNSRRLESRGVAHFAYLLEIMDELSP